MNYKLSDLKGIDQNHVAKLRESGIETTSDMMELWHDRPKRMQVAGTAGLTEEQFTRVVSMARMARLKGVGPKYVELLVTAGMIGRRSMSTHTPETLMKHLAQVSAAKKLTGPVPTLVEVGAWYAQLTPVDAPAD